MLAEKWDESIDPTGWYLEWKYDGCRALWTGKKFVSRNGNTFYAPESFTRELGTDPLDGELWLAPDSFSKALSIIKQSEPVESNWAKLTYNVFDTLATSMKKQPYEVRYEYMRKTYTGRKFVNVVPAEVCKGPAHLRAYHDEAKKQGQEGVMLRRPGSLYQHGRSKDLLKVKDRLEADARVIGFQAGKGRLSGTMGALLCELPNGVDFKIGSGFSDDQRRHHPKKGAIVNFFYQGLTSSGRPRFPIFNDERIDLTWSDLQKSCKSK